MNRVIIHYRNKKEQIFMGINEVILDGKSFKPEDITAADIKSSKSMNLKGEGQNVAILSTDVLSFQYLAD